MWLTGVEGEVKEVIATASNGSISDHCHSCPECESMLVFDDSPGEYICRGCGYVVMERIDYCGDVYSSSGPTAKSNIAKASGCTSFLKANYGLQTDIDMTRRDYGGRAINPETVRQIANMRKLHCRLKITTKERRISSVLTMIEKICSKMLLPRSLAETAAKIYRTYSANSARKGQSIMGNAAAAVYIVCKQNMIARSLEEITNSVDCRNAKGSTIKIALKCYRDMALCVTEAQSSSDAMNSGTTIAGFDHVLPIDRYIVKIVNNSGMDRRIERMAIDIAHQTANDIILSGKDPIGIAAAYLYISCCLAGYNMHLAELADQSRVTEVTIRSRCRDILSSYHLEIVAKNANANTTCAS